MRSAALVRVALVVERAPAAVTDQRHVAPGAARAKIDAVVPNPIAGYRMAAQAADQIVQHVQDFHPAEQEETILDFVVG